MRTEKFKDLFWFGPKSNIKAGDGLEKGRFPFYTSSPKQTKWIDREQHFDEALIFGTGGLASVHFEDQPFSTSTDCIVAITTNKEIKTKFVFYYLFGNIHLLERGFKGAGLKHISKKYIENLDIPVLPIDTQNKIVAILDKASSLILKREETLKLYETLLKSSFLEFFGDPVTNNKNWEKNPLSSFGAIITGNTPPRINPEYYNNNYIEWIKTDNIIKEGIYPSQATEYLSKKGTHLGRTVESGAVIVACIAGSLSSIGRASLVNRKLAFNQQINAIQPNSNISPTFLFYLIRNCSVYIQSHATKGMKKIITKGVFQNILFINPPNELQLKFESISKKINESSFKIQNSKFELETLFKSILQMVFKSELDLNIDFELEVLINQISLQEKTNDLSKIDSNKKYLKRFIEKLNNQEFKEKDLYDKAKHGAFQLMAAKEEERKVIQEYDEKSKSLKLALK